MLIKRDPFAREELHRKEVKGGTCLWCGGTNGRGNTYAYRIETDDGRTYHYTDNARFCSESCRKTSET